MKLNRLRHHNFWVAGLLRRSPTAVRSTRVSESLPVNDMRAVPETAGLLGRVPWWRWCAYAPHPHGSATGYLARTPPAASRCRYQA